MQNQMMANGCNADMTQRGVPHTAFWFAVLMGIILLFGAAREPVETMSESERMLAPQTPIEDWHGNVRRGG